LFLSSQASPVITGDDGHKNLSRDRSAYNPLFPSLVQMSMMRFSRIFPIGLLALLVRATGLQAATPERLPAASYDIRLLATARVEALKALVVEGFWLETGDALIVSAPMTVHEQLAKQVERVTTHGNFAIEDLALLPYGCDVDSATVPDPVAVLGRHALARSSPWHVALHAEAKTVTANSVLSREYRLDRHQRGAIDPAIQVVVDQVNPARWFSRVESLAGFDRSSYSASSPTGGVNQARDWLVAQFQQLGMSTTTPLFTAGSVTANNVVAVRPGTTRADEWVLIGGHYDSRNTNNSASGTLNTPGAEDNASGCAGVLEMASLYANRPTERSLMFACYAGEEQGLFGSEAHAQALQSEGVLARIQLALIMDMIGYSGDTDFDILLESGASATQQAVITTFAALAADYAPGSRTILDTSPCCSDHMPWINRGVPALLTIENDWNLYPHYHRSTDLPANITNAQPMAEKILRTNAAAVATWAVLDMKVFGNGFE